MPRAKKVAVPAEVKPASLTAHSDEIFQLVKDLNPLLRGKSHEVVVSAFAFVMWDAGFSKGKQEGMAIRIASHIAGLENGGSIPMDGPEDIGEEELDVPAAEVKPKKNQVN